MEDGAEDAEMPPLYTKGEKNGTYAGAAAAASLRGTTAGLARLSAAGATTRRRTTAITCSPTLMQGTGLAWWGATKLCCLSLELNGIDDY